MLQKIYYIPENIYVVINQYRLYICGPICQNPIINENIVESGILFVPWITDILYRKNLKYTKVKTITY